MITNIVMAATLSLSPADFTQLTNRIDILWTEHTNRVERMEAFKKKRQAALEDRNGPPTKPFRVKKAPYRAPHFKERTK